MRRYGAVHRWTHSSQQGRDIRWLRIHRLWCFLDCTLPDQQCPSTEHIKPARFLDYVDSFYVHVHNQRTEARCRCDSRLRFASHSISPAGRNLGGSNFDSDSIWLGDISRWPGSLVRGHSDRGQHELQKKDTADVAVELLHFFEPI